MCVFTCGLVFVYVLEISGCQGGWGSWFLQLFSVIIVVGVLGLAFLVCQDRSGVIFI